MKKFPSGIEFIRAGMVLFESLPGTAGDAKTLDAAPLDDKCNCAVAVAIIIAALIALL